MASSLASPQVYLVDRVTQQRWPLTQVTSELGIDRNTIRSRLDRHGLRRTKQTAR
jgi:transcriptional regulator of acetoin/glycerol metabolism